MHRRDLLKTAAAAVLCPSGALLLPTDAKANAIEEHWMKPLSNRLLEVDIDWFSCQQQLPDGDTKYEVSYRLNGGDEVLVTSTTPIETPYFVIDWPADWPIQDHPNPVVTLTLSDCVYRCFGMSVRT